MNKAATLKKFNILQHDVRALGAQMYLQYFFVKSSQQNLIHRWFASYGTDAEKLCSISLDSRGSGSP